MRQKTLPQRPYQPRFRRPFIDTGVRKTSKICVVQFTTLGFPVLLPLHLPRLSPTNELPSLNLQRGKIAGTFVVSGPSVAFSALLREIRLPLLLPWHERRVPLAIPAAQRLVKYILFHYCVWIVEDSSVFKYIVS